MGFPSPAQDYVEDRLSLDALCIARPASTYFMKAGKAAPSVGIVVGALLVIDASLTPTEGAVVCAVLGGEFTLRRYVTRPVCGLAELEPPCRFTPIIDETVQDDDRTVWGVVTWWLTPASAV